jgi:hypothetical protein
MPNPFVDVHQLLCFAIWISHVPIFFYGTTAERMAREWCRSIRSADGTESAQCDVVNGGIDQMAYLVFLPQSFDVAEPAIKEY